MRIPMFLAALLFLANLAPAAAQNGTLVVPDPFTSPSERAIWVPAEPAIRTTAPVKADAPAAVEEPAPESAAPASEEPAPAEEPLETSTLDLRALDATPLPRTTLPQFPVNNAMAPPVPDMEHLRGEF